MSRFLRVTLALTLFALLPSLVMPASAQPRQLTLHMNHVDSGAAVHVLSGAGLINTCQPGGNNPCVVYVNQGATIEIAAAASAAITSESPGRFSGGTGPAASCTLSTCTFTMTADADVTVTFTAGDGPVATLTTMLAGDGSGTLWADGAACRSGSCGMKYLAGSSVQLTAAAVGTARFTDYSSGSGDASACGSSATCTFTLTGDAAVTGTFAALTSFTVTPSRAFAVTGGAAQAFTATGTYSGGSTSAVASAAGAWSDAPSLPSARASVAAAVLGGKIYAVGGNSGGGNALNTLAEFEPATQTWTPRASMLSPRTALAVATTGGQLYAIGGSKGSFFNMLASVERYDPATDSWTARASMTAVRQGLVAGAINGIIYAAGGETSGRCCFGTPVATLEAYNPASDMWTQKRPMPTRRAFAAGGVVDGILYVAGGTGAYPVSTVEAYDPATDTWTTRAPLPVPLSTATAAVADGVLYVMSGRSYDESVVYAYDPVADAWSVKTPMRTPLFSPGATSLDGIVYAIGGDATGAFTSSPSSVVQTFVDGLRWSSSAPSVVRIDQTGVATPLAPGTATIVANVGGTTCGASCPTFTVLPPTDLSLDAPADGSTFIAGATLTIGGWALNKGAPTGAGVDAIHVYAIPNGGSAIFLGVAPYGEARPDVGAIFGSQFTNCGFTLKTGSSLGAGFYTVVAYAHNAFTQQFDAVKTARITLTAPVSNPFIAVDTPSAGQTVTSAFEVGGWALDAGAPSGTGVDAVRFYIQPQGDPAPGVFIGTGRYGFARPDVGAIFGSRFDNSGYHFTITGMGPGTYTLNVYAHSTVTNSYSIVRSVPITVSATALMSIDAPSAEATITGSSFLVGGWSIDRNVEGTALSGSGVDTLHVYAYPNPGSGEAPIFLGVAAIGVSRPDVGAIYGSRYSTSGYEITVDRAAAGLAAGVYNIVVHSHSAVSNTFNNVALVRVTLQ